MSIDAIKNLSLNSKFNLEKAKNISFRSQANNLERAPEEDTLEKQGMSTGAKVAIATVVAAGLFAAGDAIFNHGKNLKKIFGMADDAAKKGADDAASGAETKVKTEAERIKDKKAALAKKNKARLEKRSEVKAEKNARKEAKAAMKARAEEKAILAEAKKNEEIALKQKKAQLASEGKLNFEVSVGGNRIIVKNGEIAECINAQNQKWMIDDKTAPEFVEKVQKAVDDKITVVIKEEAVGQKAATVAQSAQPKVEAKVNSEAQKTADKVEAKVEAEAEAEKVKKEAEKIADDTEAKAKAEAEKIKAEAEKKAALELKEKAGKDLEEWIVKEGDNIGAQFRQYEATWKEHVEHAYDSFYLSEGGNFAKIKGQVSKDGRKITRRTKKMKWVYNADETGKNLENIEVYKDGKLQGTLKFQVEQNGQLVTHVYSPTEEYFQFYGKELLRFCGPVKVVHNPVEKNTITQIRKFRDKLYVDAKAPNVDLVHSRWINFTK